MQFRYRRRIDSTIDMTPMIDTLLQLFVVFLLSMSFMSSAIRLELPQASLQQLASDAPVIVTLDAADKVFVNDEFIPALTCKAVCTPCYSKRKTARCCCERTGSCFTTELWRP